MEKVMEKVMKKVMEKKSSDFEWKQVKDIDVRHLWKCNCDDCDGEHCESVYVSPDFYAENGEPICVCGCDMDYICTEIR